MSSTSSSRIKTSITIIISLFFIGLFLWLALRGIDFPQVKQSIAKANYFWVAFAGFFALLAYWFRAIRWNLLLSPLGHSIATSNAFWAISFGYLMNLTIPRSGEIARATALYGVEKVPVDKSFGTIILERIIDLFCMLIFLGLTLMFKKEVILTFFQNQQITIPTNQIVLLLLVLLIGVLAFFILKKRLSEIPLLGKIISIIDGIFLGLGSILKLKQKGLFLVYTLGIWVSYFMAAYLVCFALPETSDFSIADGFYIVVIGTLGMMVPASGGLGPFNYAMKLGFMALFVSMGRDQAVGANVGLAYSFISLPLQLFIMLVMGLISLPILAKRKQF